MKFENIPEDVRSAMIETYQLAVCSERAPADETSAALQKKRLELLADNLRSGFKKLISD
ncbi:hypothetical protein [Atlantibacter hermannii]|uniref:hypothetical protein n=1 Tax=Atlantibacter hermannii TaxID=565 RepID=UPI0028B25E81|nr:hypothetical protein [Atlantibacter hermannii]